MAAFQAAFFLRNQYWFGELSPGQQEAAVGSAYSVRVRKGQLALCAGERPLGWHAVISGVLKLQYRTDASQRLAGLLPLATGDWFDEGPLVQGQPRRYDALALCLPQACFQELLAASPAFSQAVIGQLAVRLSQVTAVIELERTGSMEQRLALYLGRLLCPELPRLDLSQEELGCLSGMSRQAVNRTLPLLEQRGLIRLRSGRVHAVDHAAVDAFLGLGTADDQVRLRA
jgi:CRP-like cAMP-binding protein